MSDADFTAIGVDVGGTKIAVGVVKFPEGIVKSRRTIPTRAQRGGDAIFQDVEQMVKMFATEFRVGGIGVGVCEIVNNDREIASTNCVDWTKTPVRKRLSKIAPTLIEADVRAAARSEAMFGAGRGAAVFLYVSIGTGIASSLCIDGEPFKGARGASGTMASGPMPGASNALLPTLEQIASGPGLVLQYRAVGGKAETAEEVVAAAMAGDTKAVRAVQAGAVALGGSIGTLVNVLDPELVILGGGLGLREGFYRDALIDAARKHIWWVGHRDLPFVPAETGADAGLIGAAATAWTASKKREI